MPVPAALLIQLLDVTAAQVCGISLTPRVNAVTPHLGLKSSLSGVSLLAEVDDAASETTRNPSIGQLDKGSSSSSSSSSSSANTNQSSTDKSTNHQVIPNDAGMSGAADSSAPPPCVPLSVCRHLSPFDPAASAPQHAAATLDCRLGALKEQQQQEQHLDRREQQLLDLVLASLEAKHIPPALLQVRAAQCTL